MATNDPQEARNLAEVREIERKQRIQEWHDYISFAARNLTGFGLITVGGLEFMWPELISATLSNPGAVAGGGLALIMGTSVINILAKVFDALK